MNIAIILAAGKGTRMKLDTNKVFVKLKKPILAHTLDAFEKNTDINSIIVVANDRDSEEVEEICGGFRKVTKIVSGGRTRQESSYNGVFACEDCDVILIHDGARPFIRQETITQSILDAQKYGASVVGVPVKDTIKEVSNGMVERTLVREKLFCAQTPQAFRSDLIRKAHEKALYDKFVGTDDVSLVERMGIKVRLTPGNYDNIKITTPDDLEFAKCLLEKK